jgi:Holliday junction resolvase
MTTDTICLVLPFPPSVNGLYAPVAKGRLVLSEAGRVFKAQAGWLARDAYRDVPMACDVALRVNVYRPRRRGDLSNLLKVVEDAFTGIVYVDDGQIVEEHLYRHEDPTYPRVEVEILRVKA